MNNFVENLADFFKSLFKLGGFWGGSFLFLCIGIVLAFIIIKNRYEIPFICNSLQGEYSKLKEKNDDDGIANLFVKNGVMLLGIVYVNLIKVITGLIYSFILRTDTLSFLDLSFTNFPLTDYGYQILKVPDSNRTVLIFFALLYAWAQSITNKSISMKSLIETNRLDFFASAAVFVLCLLAPAGFCFYALAFTLIECVLTTINIGPLHNSNQQKIEKKVEKYKTEFNKKVQKIGKSK